MSSIGPPGLPIVRNDKIFTETPPEAGKQLPMSTVQKAVLISQIVLMVGAVLGTFHSTIRAVSSAAENLLGLCRPWEVIYHKECVYENFCEGNWNPVTWLGLSALGLVSTASALAVVEKTINHPDCKKRSFANILSSTTSITLCYGSLAGMAGELIRVPSTFNEVPCHDYNRIALLAESRNDTEFLEALSLDESSCTSIALHKVHLLAAGIFFGIAMTPTLINKATLLAKKLSRS